MTIADKRFQRFINNKEFEEIYKDVVLKVLYQFKSKQKVELKSFLNAFKNLMAQHTAQAKIAEHGSWAHSSIYEHFQLYCLWRMESENLIKIPNFK